ncbi:TrmH family RNA methyltransferase [Georgenia faecalis]|uniref:TrmH family RNA methyltransferase n=1 Tax=Georgenia faecalis TaxID=2483799 RepID=A0ABV9DCA3_9MICO|nr:RNA methyltransferase [Georgenia faecalis]
MDHVADRLTERLRRVRALHQRSVRRREGRFLVEGPQGAREAVRHAAPAVREVLLTPGAATRYPEIAGFERVQLVTEEVSAALSADSQGVLAVVDAAAVATDEGALAGARLVAVLARVTDPGNAGAVIRAADAAGADAVVLTAGSVELLNPKVVRSTAGSLFHLPVLTGADAAASVAAVRAAGLQVLAADGRGRWDLHALDGAGAPDLARPTAWLFGTEAQGLSADERALADATVRVPVHGLAESLNLATAATVCLYESARVQRA